MKEREGLWHEGGERAEKSPVNRALGRGYTEIAVVSVFLLLLENLLYCLYGSTVSFGRLSQFLLLFVFFSDCHIFGGGYRGQENFFFRRGERAL